MSWKLISADPNAPHGLSLARVKEHARISHDDEDLAIDGMLFAVPVAYYFVTLVILR